MKKVIIALVACTALAGCSNLSSTLSVVGTDLGIVAADLPTACGNLSAEITTVAATPGLPTNVSAAITAANTKYSAYCGPAATVVTDAAAAIAAVQAVIGTIQAAQAAQ